MFSCDICGIHFTENRSLTRHKESKHVDVKYSCDKCNYQANRKDNLSRHMKTKHRRIDAGDVEAGPHLSPEKEKTGGDVGREHDVDHEPHLSPEKEKSQIGGDVGGEHDVDHEPHLSPEKEKSGGDVGGEPHKFKCPHCSGAFSSRSSLFNHVKLHSNTGKGWICDQCGQQFPRKDYFERHKCARPPTKIKTRKN